MVEREYYYESEIRSFLYQIENALVKVNYVSGRAMVTDWKDIDVRKKPYEQPKDLINFNLDEETNEMAKILYKISAKALEAANHITSSKTASLAEPTEGRQVLANADESED